MKLSKHQRDYTKAQTEIDSKLSMLKKMRSLCERQKRLPTEDEKDQANITLKEIEALEARQKALWAVMPEPPAPDITPVDTRRDKISSGQPTARSRTGDEISYRGLFGEPEQVSNGFKTFSEFIHSVASNRYDPRLKTESRTQNIGTPSDGGFLIEEQMAKPIIDLAISKSFFLKNATLYPCSGPVLKVPAVSDTDHSSSRGGLVSLWKAEESQLSLDSITLRQLEFNIHKLTLLIKSSREFLEDGLAAEQFIKNTMAAEIAWQLDHNIINTGTGAGMPLSILNSAATISVAKESGQGADTLIWENIVKMVAAFNPGSEDRGVWFFSPSLKNEVFTMTQAIGTGGSLVHPDPAGTKERGLSLLGYPVRFVEHCNIAGDKGDAMLINPKAYAIALRSDLRLEASSHAEFASDQVVFKATTRVDGMPIAAEPLTLADGTTQVSDFVTLDERA